jgi:hypothetical protein
MVEIFPDLWIGTEFDYESKVKGQLNWDVVHACKEPYHRRLLGYSSPGAPKNHPEYLFAIRENRLFLNLVDAPNPAFISKLIIDTALDFIHSGLEKKHKVLVHCNLGESRSPGIGILYLAKYTDLLPKAFPDAEIEYKKIYPYYNPAGGVHGFLITNWNFYIS